MAALFMIGGFVAVPVDIDAIDPLARPLQPAPNGSKLPKPFDMVGLLVNDGFVVAAVPKISTAAGAFDGAAILAVVTVLLVNGSNIGAVTGVAAVDMVNSPNIFVDATDDVVVMGTTGCETLSNVPKSSKSATTGGGGGVGCTGGCAGTGARVSSRCGCR